MSLPKPTVLISSRIKANEKLTPEELIDFMNLNGISKKEMSEILGVTIQAINLWLSGDRDISITNSRLINIFKKYPKLIREF